MKQLRNLVAIAILLFGATALQAQSKVGHINTQLVLSLMPEAKALDAELQKLEATYSSELQAEQEKLEAKVKKYEAEAPSQTPEVNNQRRAEVQQDQANLYQASQIAQEDINNKRNEKLQPILEKLITAIREVADEQGFDYVLEEPTLIVAKGTDLLPAVKAKLGLE
jgi:outer membrane protein